MFAETALPFGTNGEFGTQFEADAFHLLHGSRWFTRGWTLQELIALEQLRLFDADWCYVGDRADFAAFLHEITGIDAKLFLWPDTAPKTYARLSLLRERIDEYSIAERMCWASRRETSRVEDEAYSLLGLFNVNMPLLYGERQNAFIHLQEEIIKKSTDGSILMWSRSKYATESERTQSLARRCRDFADSGNIVRRHYGVFDTSDELINAGLRMTAPIIVDDSKPLSKRLVLNCCHREHPFAAISVRLRCAGTSNLYTVYRSASAAEIIMPQFLTQCLYYGDIRNRTEIQTIVVGRSIRHNLPPAEGVGGERHVVLITGGDDGFVEIRDTFPRKAILFDLFSTQIVNLPVHDDRSDGEPKPMGARLQLATGTRWPCFVDLVIRLRHVTSPKHDTSIAFAFIKDSTTLQRSLECYEFRAQRVDIPAFDKIWLTIPNSSHSLQATLSLPDMENDFWHITLQVLHHEEVPAPRFVPPRWWIGRHNRQPSPRHLTAIHGANEEQPGVAFGLAGWP